MDYPLDTIRLRFPSLSRNADSGTAPIYFDNPAGTQVSDLVVERMRDCLIESNANLGGAFETSRRADDVVANAHRAMADFLNATSSDEVIFGQNMTTLTLHISRSIGRTLEAGDRIVVSRMDHDANVTPWTLLADDLGLEVSWLPFDVETFEFDLDELAVILEQRPKLLCVGGASNLTGTVNDVKSICRMARDAGTLTYIDAVQLAPHVAIDVQDMDCDFLACSAYKFFGPHQGVLYGRLELLQSLTPYKVRPASKAPPFSYETGTQSHEGMAGTAAAIDYFAWIGETFAQDYHDRNSAYASRRGLLRSAMQYLFDYEQILAGRLLNGLASIPGVRVHGITDSDALDRRVPTVAFTAEGGKPADIAGALGDRGIFVWSGHNYAVEVAHALGIYASGGAVRVGPVHYNSVEEIDHLLNALDDILPARRPAKASP